MEFRDKIMFHCLQGTEMSAGLHFRNLIFDTKSCRIKSTLVDRWPCRRSFHGRAWFMSISC